MATEPIPTVFVESLKNLNASLDEALDNINRMTAALNLMAVGIKVDLTECFPKQIEADILNADIIQ